jgi:hypothetical protein
MKKSRFVLMGLSTAVVANLDCIVFKIRGERSVCPFAGLRQSPRFDLRASRSSQCQKPGRGAALIP